jgi:hypothetical protein
MQMTKNSFRHETLLKTAIAGVHHFHRRQRSEFALTGLCSLEANVALKVSCDMIMEGQLPQHKCIALEFEIHEEMKSSPTKCRHFLV